MTAWRTRPLGNLCRFSNGLWKGEKPPFTGVGVIRNTNFTKEGTLDYSDIAQLEVEATKLEKRRLQFGDIILEKSGGGPKQPVGRVALFDRHDGDFSFSNFTATLRVLEPDELDFRFLHRFLHWNYLSGVTEAMQSHSTGIRNLDADAYKAIEVSYPPLPEQQRIVALLDEAFAGIARARANTEQNLRNAHDVFETQLDAIFSRRDAVWAERRLGDVCSISSKLVDPRLDDYVDLTHVGAGNIESATGKLWRLQTAREEALISGKFLFDETMVLYSKIRPYLRKVGRPEFKGLCSADIYPLSPEPGKITRGYLYYVLLSRRFTEYAMQGSARAGMPKVNRDHLFEYRVWLPAVEQQAKEAAVLDLLADDTARLATVYEQKLAALDALKQSLLHQAFAGAL
jgi:type I restriction enzyme S subunit